MKSSQEKKLKELVDKINYHNDLYYNKDKPKISDAKYDDLIAQFRKIQNKLPKSNFKRKLRATLKDILETKLITNLKAKLNSKVKSNFTKKTN